MGRRDRRRSVPGFYRGESLPRDNEGGLLTSISRENEADGVYRQRNP